MDYTEERIKSQLYIMPGLTNVYNQMHDVFSAVKQLPLSLKPKYFSKTIEKLFNSALSSLMNEKLTDDFIRESQDPFLQALALATVQMYA